MQDSKSKPDSGSPKAAAVEIMRRIYGDGSSAPEEVTLPDDDEEDPDPHEEEHEELPAILKTPPPLRPRTTPCRIRVNEVGFTVPVIDVSVSKHAVCMLLPEEGWECDIPLSKDVQILFRDVEYHVCFMGGIHKFSQAGYQAVWFVIMDAQNTVDPGKASV